MSEILLREAIKRSVGKVGVKRINEGVRTKEI